MDEFTNDIVTLDIPDGMQLTKIVKVRSEHVIDYTISKKDGQFHGVSKCFLSFVVPVQTFWFYNEGVCQKMVRISTDIYSHSFTMIANNKNYTMNLNYKTPIALIQDLVYEIQHHNWEETCKRLVSNIVGCVCITQEVTMYGSLEERILDIMRK